MLHSVPMATVVGLVWLPVWCTFNMIMVIIVVEYVTTFNCQVVNGHTKL